MNKFKITEKKINYDEVINNSKELLETYKKMKKENKPIPQINNVGADIILIKQIHNLENEKKNKK